MYERWGGKPTTQLLRHRDSSIDEFAAHLTLARDEVSSPGSREHVPKRIHRKRHDHEQALGSHHRGYGIGRGSRCRPAQRRSQPARARPGSGTGLPDRARDAPGHPQCLRRLGRQARLALHRGSGSWPRHPVCAREGDRRLLRRQRIDRAARPTQRLRRVGGGGMHRVGLARRLAVLEENRGRSYRRPLSWQRGPHARRTHAARRAHRGTACLHSGMPGERLRTRRRSQRSGGERRRADPHEPPR